MKQVSSDFVLKEKEKFLILKDDFKLLTNDKKGYFKKYLNLFFAKAKNVCFSF